jgi:hypothetical protein
MTAGGLERICAAVDVILKEVENAPTKRGAVERDVNDAFLRAAYGRAYRCLRSIRELACRGEADDAMILTAPSCRSSHPPSTSLHPMTRMSARGGSTRRGARGASKP